MITLSRTISSLGPSWVAKMRSKSIVPMIILSLKARVGRGITSALTRGHLMLSKDEGHAQDLGTMRFSDTY